MNEWTVFKNHSKSLILQHSKYKPIIKEKAEIGTHFARRRAVFLQ